VPIETVEIAGRFFEVELPDAERMLQDAVAGEANGAAGWDPYWGLLWAAAPRTAELLIRAAPQWESSLELGCGVGLAGIAGLSTGRPVTFSDQSAAAVEMAVRNAARNGYESAPGLVFAWDEPVEQHFDFLFGSDILYDKGGHGPLLQTLSAMLMRGGRVWIGDAGRSNAPLFVERAQREGWKVRQFDSQLQPLRQPELLQFRLLILERGG